MAIQLSQIFASVNASGKIIWRYKIEIDIFNVFSHFDAFILKFKYSIFAQAIFMKFYKSFDSVPP